MQHSSSNQAIRREFQTASDEDISIMNFGTRILIPIFSLPIVIASVMTEYVPETWNYIEVVGWLTLFGVCVVNPIASYFLDLVLFTVYPAGGEAQLYLDYPSLWYSFKEKTLLNFMNIVGSVYVFGMWRDHVDYFRELLLMSEDEVADSNSEQTPAKTEETEPSPQPQPEP